MKHIPIRLGPLALLLTVISICMTVLGILSFTTARADYSLAEKYAATVRDRYRLEKEGQNFLREAGEALQAGKSLDTIAGVSKDEEGILHKTFEYDEFRLQVGLIPEGDSSFRVVEWWIEKDWEPDSDISNLWDGT